jgi:hypothetical protein
VPVYTPNMQESNFVDNVRTFHEVYNDERILFVLHVFLNYLQSREVFVGIVVLMTSFYVYTKLNV